MASQDAGAKPGFFGRVRDALRRTGGAVRETLSTPVFGGKGPSPELLEDLESALLRADFGVAAAREAVEAARKELSGKPSDSIEDVLRAVRRGLLGILSEVERKAPPVAIGPPPRIVFFVGVNGVGKTTTIGKIALRLRAEGQNPVLAAADTFRAAAIEQLETWAGRAGVDVVRHKSGSDPAAVVFDAVVSAKARGADAVLVDTAGRLHTKDNLMRELEKMRRIAAREAPQSPMEALLVLDATTGQNGLRQAEEFARAAGLTGIVLTKLDGTAKGGIALCASRALGVPIRWVGVGEGAEDLAPFRPEEYVDGILGLDSREAS